MIIAPPLPPQQKRRGRIFDILSTLGFGGAAAVLLLLNLVLLLATHYYVTPQELYHRTWEVTADHIFDPRDLGDWAAWEHKFDGQIRTDEDAIQRANEMLQSIGDRYTYLMSPEAVSQDRDRSQGNYAGIGMILGVKTDGDGQPVKAADGKPLPETDADGYPLVKQLINSGPAKTTGVQVGDAITSINGVSTVGLSLDVLVGKIRGPEGEPVTFGIRRNGQDLTLTIVRAKVNVPSVTTRMLPGDIGYLRLEGFDQYDASEEFEAGLEDLKDARALVIDLRGNPGGFVFNAINIASFFIEEGQLVTMKSRIPGRGYETQVVRLSRDRLVVEQSSTETARVRVDESKRQPYLAAGRPVVVLVNGNSASASEMFTGAVKDNNAAVVVGTRTFGKGVGQSNIPMPNGTMLHVTSLRYYTPDGTWLGDGNSTNNGIEPHIIVEPARNLEFGGDTDNQLDKAIEILKQKLNGSSSLRPPFRTIESIAG